MYTKQGALRLLDRLHDTLADGMYDCHEFNTEVGVWFASPAYYEELGKCLVAHIALDIQRDQDPAQGLIKTLQIIELMTTVRKPYAPSTTETATIQSV